MASLNTEFRIFNIWAGAESALHAGREAQAHHHSAFWAATKNIVANNWLNVALIGTAGAGWGYALGYTIAMAPSLIHLGSGLVQSRNILMSDMSVPFSQSFEHSDWTLKAQQRGLQALSGANSALGSEAGAMAKRYARR
jgi:hypothetical protein